MTTFSDWRSLLVDLLVGAGTTGIKQRDIIHKLQAYADADTLIDELQSLRKQRKVQKFGLPSGPRGGRPATVWRATKLILEEE